MTILNCDSIRIHFMGLKLELAGQHSHARINCFLELASLNADPSACLLVTMCTIHACPRAAERHGGRLPRERWGAQVGRHTLRQGGRQGGVQEPGARVCFCYAC